MNSYDVQDHGEKDPGEPGKKPWVTPSLQVIPLKSAESGQITGRSDYKSGKFQRVYS
jgi:hypothetical protein